MKQVPIAEIEQLTRGEHGQPHAILGPHPDGDGVTFRVYKPLARTVTVVTADGTRVSLEHEHEGVWVGESGPVVSPRRRAPSSTGGRAAGDAAGDVPDYRVEVDYGAGRDHRSTTPTASCRRSARWTSTWSTRAGTSCCGRCSGARVHHYRASTGDVTGTSFAVWAPGARGVRLEGDFNSWDGREHPMRQLGHVGRVGAVRARGRRGRRLQVRDPRRRRRVAREGRPDGVLGRGAAGHVEPGLRVDPRVGRRRLDAVARRQAAGRRADVGLRGAPRRPGGSGTATC